MQRMSAAIDSPAWGELMELDRARASLDVVRHDLVGTRHELEEARARVDSLRTRLEEMTRRADEVAYHSDLCAMLHLDPALAPADDVLRLVGECVDRATEAEGRPSDRDPRDARLPAHKLLDCQSPWIHNLLTTRHVGGPHSSEATMAISVQSEGRRHYLVGDTFPIKDQLRSCGAKWDPDRRAWWTGKREVAERFTASAPASIPTNDAPDSRPADTLTEDSRIAGKATYKGKPYILVWEGETRRGRSCKLAFADGSKVFWAAASEVQVTKRYESREHRGHVEHMTFGRLQRLREKFARAREQGNDDGICDGQRYECPECGEYVVRGQGSCWETGCAH